MNPEVELYVSNKLYEIQQMHVCFKSQGFYNLVQ